MDHPAHGKADASLLTGVSETALLTLNGRAYQSPLATRYNAANDVAFQVS